MKTKIEMRGEYFNASVRKLAWVRGILQPGIAACGLGYHRNNLCWMTIRSSTRGIRIKTIPQTLESALNRELALIAVERSLAVEMLGTHSAIEKYISERLKAEKTKKR